MKYQNIIENMTLKEKAAFLSGKKRVADKGISKTGHSGNLLFRRTKRCA